MPKGVDTGASAAARRVFVFAINTPRSSAFVLLSNNRDN